MKQVSWYKERTQELFYLLRRHLLIILDISRILSLKDRSAYVLFLIRPFKSHFHLKSSFISRISRNSASEIGVFAWRGLKSRAHHV